jgi:hypothetical protein
MQLHGLISFSRVSVVVSTLIESIYKSFYETFYCTVTGIKADIFYCGVFKSRIT